MCECHQCLVGSGVVFGDSFTMINPLGSTSRERERGVCGSHAGLGATLCTWGTVGWGGWALGLDQKLLWLLQQSGSVEAGREREREGESDLIAPALSLFSQSVTTLGLGETAPGNMSDPPPVTAHVYTHTCTYTHAQGRGNVVTTALNCECQRLPLQMAYSHVQPSNRHTNHSHTHTYTHTVTLNPSLLPCYMIIHLPVWDFIRSYEVGPIFSPFKCFLTNLPGCVHEQNIGERKKHFATSTSV